MRQVQIDELIDNELSDIKKEFERLRPLFKKFVSAKIIADKSGLSLSTIYSYWKGVIPDNGRCELIIRESKLELEKQDIKIED